MFFFILSILMYWLQDFSNKQFCLACKKSSHGTALLQNAVCCLCASLLLMLTTKMTLPSLDVALLALLFGVTYLGTVFLLLCAFMRGTMGLSTLLCNLGMFIAAFYGIVRFHDPITPFIATGFLCMLAAVILCTPKKENAENGGLQWFLFAFGSGLCNGIVASVKREAVALLAQSTQSFLAFGFLFAGLIAALFALLPRCNRVEAVALLRAPRVMRFGVLAGVGTVLANLFQLKALLTVPSTVVYPLTSGTLVVSLWLASLLLYREVKARPKNVIAVVLCVIAIVLANRA